MTVTKYLNVLSTLGLIKKKKMGSVNVWFLESGIVDFEPPINYLEVQQKFMNALIAGDEYQARNIIVSIVNFEVQQIKILTEVIIPTINTLNEIYYRGRLGKTERISLLNLLDEIVYLLKFNVAIQNIKHDAYAVFVSASEEVGYQAKIATVALQILGWKTSYIGNVEQHIDPFFDLDFQRYIAKVWNNKKGLLLICICSSEESSSQFLFAAAKPMKSKLKGHVSIVLLTKAENLDTGESIRADFVAKDLQSLINWAEIEYGKFT